MKRTITSLGLDKEVKDHIDQNTQLKSFADWVNNTYRDEFMILEKEKERVKSLEWDLQLARQRVTVLEKVVFESVLSIKAEEWLRTEGLKRSKKPGVDLDAIRRFFNEEFALNLTNKDFRLQIDRLEAEL